MVLAELKNTRHLNVSQVRQPGGRAGGRSEGWGHLLKSQAASAGEFRLVGALRHGSITNIRQLLSLATANRAHALATSWGRSTPLERHPPGLRGDKHVGTHMENPRLPATHQ